MYICADVRGLPSSEGASAPCMRLPGNAEAPLGYAPVFVDVVSTHEQFLSALVLSRHIAVGTNFRVVKFSCCQILVVSNFSVVKF